MPRVICEYYKHEKKCGSCFRNVQRHYAFEGEDVDDIGICADCFLGMIIDEKHEVVKPIKEDEKAL